MPSTPGRHLTTLLHRLCEAGVEFILVGGLAAVVQGAPITTVDVDIVHARSDANLDALLGVLTALNARYRGQLSADPLPPSRQALAGPGHSLFMTDLGPLDCLGAIEQGRDFDALLPHSLELQTSAGRVRVLDLGTIVDLKRLSSHSKDQQMLPILEATLRRRGRG